MAMNIQFFDSDWQRISRDWKAWWAGELNRPLVFLETFDPSQESDWCQLAKFGLDTPINSIIDNRELVLGGTRWYGDAFPKWFVNYGAGSLAAFLGSRVTYAATTDTTWFWPLENAASLSDIRPRFDTENPWWQRTKETIRQAVERWGDKVLVSIPDLGGNLDTMAALRGSEKLLFDLMDSPDEIERLTKEITQLWIHYYDDLYSITSLAGRGNASWGPCWSPGKGYMLQCDFSYMISPDMFERFVMPDLEACCNHLDYAFFHMDGKGEIPHLDHLLSLKRLRGIQWQPGAGQPLADGWLPLLKRIRDAGKLCQVYVNCEGALKIKRELGGKGFLMQIVNENLTHSQADSFAKELLSGYWEEDGD